MLGTGPSSLYAHIVNKDDIDDLLIGRLCSELVLPKPDPARWREGMLAILLTGGIQPQTAPGPSTPTRSSGTGHQRFDFALAPLIDNLAPQAPPT